MQCLVNGLKIGELHTADPSPTLKPVLAADFALLENIMVMREGLHAPGALKATATASNAMNKTNDRNMFLENKGNIAKQTLVHEFLKCYFI